MKELSLNILDITENSVKAGATLTQILIEEKGNLLTLSIIDDGCGMSEEVVKRVTDPFYTTRTTRSVGMGLPLLQMEAEMTGGEMTVFSTSVLENPENHGTRVVATFYKDHIDFTPLGDVISTMTTLIQGHPDTDFRFVHTMENGEVELDTKEIREVLGDDVPLNTYEVIKWIEDNLKEQYQDLTEDNVSN